MRKGHARCGDADQKEEASRVNSATPERRRPHTGGYAEQAPTYLATGMGCRHRGGQEWTAGAAGRCEGSWQESAETESSRADRQSEHLESLQSWIVQLAQAVEALRGAAQRTVRLLEVEEDTEERRCLGRPRPATIWSPVEVEQAKDDGGHSVQAAVTPAWRARAEPVQSFRAARGCRGRRGRRKWLRGERGDWSYDQGRYSGDRQRGQAGWKREEAGYRRGTGAPAQVPCRASQGQAREIVVMDQGQAVAEDRMG